MLQTVTVHTLEDQTTGNHVAPSATARTATEATPATDNRNMARAIRETGRDRGNAISRGSGLRAATMSLHRPGKDPVSACDNRFGNERRSDRCLANRASIRQDPTISICCYAWLNVILRHRNSPAVSAEVRPGEVRPNRRLFRLPGVPDVELFPEPVELALIGHRVAPFD